MPAGTDVTVPDPVPAFETARLSRWILKVPTTLVALFMVTTHTPVPVHPPPDQLAKVEPVPAVGVRVTSWPAGKFAAHVEPQSMPAGDDLMVPVPVPDLEIERRYVWTANVAVTVVALFKVTTHVPVPLHPPPDQPLNTEPEAAEAVRVTVVP